ncbi:MAG TPA: AAA family ATPase [Actinomycetota bacterium]|nr:AAA family ATPase [Actinomycetota bacterium]
MGEVSKLLGQESVLTMAQAADVLGVRERRRRRRLWTLAAILAGPIAFLWYRIGVGRPFNPFAFPHLSGEALYFVPMLVIFVVVAAVMVVPFLMSGRSPHVMFRPEQIDVSLDDVKGLEAVREEVIRTLNVFLGYATFRRELGGNPRRGVLFEGPPGTGKTHLAKAMAKHAGVPFLFVSGPAFQSMWYGMTARKIRKYFKALKTTARKEGGAIGFIEEIDSFATRRGGLDGMSPSVVKAAFGSEPSIASGTGGTVNELLIQMQSFDDPPSGQAFLNKIKDFVNTFLPLNRQLKKKSVDYANVLVIAATNRGDMLDPALLRPGRFDRRLYFDVPSRSGRRDLIDYFLEKKKHGPDLEEAAKRDELAGMTFGYSPVMIEHLFDEALIWALRGGRDGMNWEDVTRAKLTGEIGLPAPVSYTADERRAIATHEAGHAVAAYLAGEGRTLEVLSIIKRRDALGLLGHSESEERFTKTRTELEALLKISLGGMAAEEIFEGESGTGPAGDLAHATQIAAEMIGSLGLGGSLISFRAVSEGVLDPGLVGRVLANGDAKRSVDALLKKEKRDVKGLLNVNRKLVIALRDALLDRDELIGDQIVEVLERAGGKRKSRRRPARV